MSVYLTDEQVMDIRGMYAEGETIAAISRAYGMGRYAVQSVIVGRTYKHLRAGISKKAETKQRTEVEFSPDDLLTVLTLRYIQKVDHVTIAKVTELPCSFVLQVLRKFPRKKALKQLAA